MPSAPKLIRCGDHKLAPWCIVCVHLESGASNEWRPIPQGPESDTENDWLCPECLALFPNIPEQNMRALCIHCVRKLRSAS
jgi:hypothetical protein